METETSKELEKASPSSLDDIADKQDQIAREAGKTTIWRQGIEGRIEKIESNQVTQFLLFICAFLMGVQAKSFYANQTFEDAIYFLIFLLFAVLAKIIEKSLPPEVREIANNAIAEAGKTIMGKLKK